MTNTPSPESQALDLARQAIAEDQKQNYSQAYQLYKSAIAVMLRVIKCTFHAAHANPRLKSVLEKKTNEWLVRAEELKQLETQASSTVNCSPADPPPAQPTYIFDPSTLLQQSPADPPSAQPTYTFDPSTLLQQGYSLYQAAAKADEEQLYEEACRLYLEGAQQLEFALQCKS